MKVDAFAVVLIAFLIIGCDTEKNESNSEPISAWARITNGLGQNINSLVSANGKMFAGSYYGGLLVSSDSGHTWASITLEAQFTPHVFSLKLIDTNIFACTGYTIYHSTDQGVTWAADSAFLKTNALVIECKNIATIANEHFVALQVVGGSNIPSVFHSTDSGLNWSPLATNQYSQKERIVANGNTLILSGVYGGPVFSINGGINWSVPQTTIPSPAYITCLYVWNEAVYAGTDEKGIYRAVGYPIPDVWSTVNVGLASSSHIYSIVANDTNIFVSTEQGVAKSLDGQSWTAISDTLVNHPTYLEVIGDYLYAASDGEIWRAKISELR